MTDSVLFTIDKETFSEFIIMSSLARRDKYLEFLNSVPILNRLYTYDRQNLCDAMNVQTFEEGDIIIQEGDRPGNFYIVYSGMAQAFRDYHGDKRLVYEIKERDYFGDIDLMAKRLVSMTVVAVGGQCQIIVIDKGTFKRLLNVIGWDLSQNESKYNSN